MRSLSTALSTTAGKEDDIEEPPSIYKEPTLRLRVPRPVLEGGNAPPFRRNRLMRLLRRLGPSAAVRVEQGHPGIAASVLHAPDGSVDEYIVQTEPISTIPRRGDDLVYQDDDFEISVVGMHVKNFDSWGPLGENELFMYSQDTTGASGSAVHYDYEVDEYCGSQKPDVFVPIPASKSYVTGSTKDAKTSSVNVRFNLLELDKPNQTTKDAINGLSSLTSLLPTVPLLGATEPVFKVAAALSKKALHSYARPDKVIVIDMDFMLADRNRVSSPGATPYRRNSFLKYGYYFFLSEPIEGRLYATVGTCKNVQLMFRRQDEKAEGKRRISAKQFIPLTNVNYIVVRVTEPSGALHMARDASEAHKIQAMLSTPV